MKQLLITFENIYVLNSQMFGANKCLEGKCMNKN